MKKYLATAIAIVLALGAGISPASAKGWDFPEANSVPAGSTLVAINEPSYFDTWNSWYSVGDMTNGARPESHICPAGPDATNCDPSKFQLHALSLLGPCETATSENCIAGISFANAEGTKTAAVLDRVIGGTTYEGKPELNLVGASEISLWKAEGFNHGGGGNTYAAAIKLDQWLDKNTGKYAVNAFSATLIPYTNRGPGMAPKHQETKDADGVTRIGTIHDATCTWADSQGCGLPEDFADNVRVELSLRLSNQVTGWFRGRIRAPEAAISQFSATNNNVILSGEPVTVPRFSTYITAENTPEVAIPALTANGGKNPNAPLFSGRSIKDYFANNGQYVFQMMDWLRQASKDTAAGESRLWNFSTIDTRSNNKCMNDKSKVLGMVTTNATAYDGEVPTFKGGQLSYKVSGLHYAPDGKTLNEGSYDLVMRSDVARCLYGFSKAPVSATISVVGDGGENKVATTVVNEKDGWLRLAAYGFTYSSPTISVKLSQPKAAVKTTITCVKKKLVKKVTGTAPKCPAGYAKK